MEVHNHTLDLTSWPFLKFKSMPRLETIGREESLTEGEVVTSKFLFKVLRLQWDQRQRGKKGNSFLALEYSC